MAVGVVNSKFACQHSELHRPCCEKAVKFQAFLGREPLCVLFLYFINFIE